MKYCVQIFFVNIDNLNQVIKNFESRIGRLNKYLITKRNES
jgi:hypothetical protein